MNYVYTGNVVHRTGASTWCPSCGALLIERQGYELGTYALDENHCKGCGHTIAGQSESAPGTAVTSRCG